MDLSRPLINRHKICTQLSVGSSLKICFRKFSQPLKNWRGKPQISPTCRQSKVRNFQTAQHIDKQIKDVLFMINAL